MSSNPMCYCKSFLPKFLYLNNSQAPKHGNTGPLKAWFYSPPVSTQHKDFKKFMAKIYIYKTK